MDFTLRKEHEMARALFKEFAEKEVKPLAQEVDETEEFPRETARKMAKNGFLGIPVPKEYGGQGCDPLTYVMCVEELSKVCGTTGVIVSAGFTDHARQVGQTGVTVRYRFRTYILVLRSHHDLRNGGAEGKISGSPCEGREAGSLRPYRARCRNGRSGPADKSCSGRR